MSRLAPPYKLSCAGERRSGEQEVAAGSNPSRTNIQGLKITEDNVLPQFVITSANG